MTVHPEFLELISASIDFDLTEDERGRLNLHLSECAACRRTGAELRSVAAEVAAAPRPQLGATRSEAILAAALRRPTTRPRWGLLAVAALLATLGGGLIAGLGLLNADDPRPSLRPSPTPVAEVSAEPSEVPSATPARPGVPGTSTPTPRPPAATAAPPPQTAGLAFPLRWTEELGAIRVAPTDDGRLWVSVGRESGTVLALLDRDGDPAAGWPIEIELATDCAPYVLRDQSIRLACSTSEVDPETCVDICSEDRILAWDPGGNPIPGWPVSLGVRFEGGFQTHSGRVIGTDLLMIQSGDGEFNPETGQSGVNELVRFRSDGTAVRGASVPGMDWCCRIAPDGTAYGRWVLLTEDGSPPITSVVAFDETGVLPGWPVELAGVASVPGVGPDGRLYLSSWLEDEASQLVILRPDGSQQARTGIDGRITWDPRWEAPMRPLIDARGRLFLVANDRVHAYDAGGERLPGWPYDPETRLEGFRECDTGSEDGSACYEWALSPVLDPAGVLYVTEVADGSKGARLTAVGLDGARIDEWPLVLQRPGARFESVALSDDRTIFAVAHEPEPGGQMSITILAVERDKTIRWRTTIVQP